MVSYSIEWKNSAKKELKRLPKNIIGKVVTAVSDLSKNPHPINSRKLAGSNHTYRLRVNDYRIIYLIVNDRLIIEVIKVGHRQSVYKN